MKKTHVYNGFQYLFFRIALAVYLLNDLNKRNRNKLYAFLKHAQYLSINLTGLNTQV